MEAIVVINRMTFYLHTQPVPLLSKRFWIFLLSLRLAHCLHNGEVIQRERLLVIYGDPPTSSVSSSSMSSPAVLLAG